MVNEAEAFLDGEPVHSILMQRIGVRVARATSKERVLWWCREGTSRCWRRWAHYDAKIMHRWRDEDVDVGVDVDENVDEAMRWWKAWVRMSRCRHLTVQSEGVKCLRLPSAKGGGMEGAKLNEMSAEKVAVGGRRFL